MTGSGLSKIILVASAKGGVGKSTVALNLAHALSARGLTVLLADCDFRNRALDLMLGCEDDALFDIGDLLSGAASPPDVLKRSHGMYFAPGAPAPVPYEPDGLLDALRSLADAVPRVYGSDDGGVHIVVDTSGTELPAALARAARHVIVVASQSPVSVRAAERTGEAVSAAKRVSLVINGFDAGGASSRRRAGVVELIDGVRLPLLGVVPYDEALASAQEKGITAVENDPRSPASRAFINIAARLCGEQTPLFYKTSQYRRRRRLY